MTISKETFLGRKGNNLSLYYNRFAFAEMSDDNKDLANDLLKKIREIPKEPFYDRLGKRRDLVESQFQEQRGMKVIKFIATSKTRFLLGAGSPSPTEVGFHFCRNYGVPVIPGSSLKGAFYHFLVDEGHDGNELKKWFGCGADDSQEEAQRGSIQFLDGLPIGSVQYQLDIVNNHFPEYYGDEKNGPPNDWYNPIPVRFLTVAAGAKIRFTLIVKQEVKDRVTEIQKQFKAMLAHWGVGAKTAYGYGRFTSGM